MLREEQNDLITRTNPERLPAPCYAYWPPAALVDELVGNRPVKAMRLIGDDRSCSGTRRAATALSGGIVRIAAPTLLMGGWKPAACAALSRLAVRRQRQVLQTPAEPDDSNVCANIKLKSYPVVEKSGSCRVSGRRRAAAFRNWISSSRVDPHLRLQGRDRLQLAAIARGRHRSGPHAFLRRFFEDEDADKGFGKMFRDTSKDSDMPMTQMMREFPRPRIEVEPTDSASGWSRCARSATRKRMCASPI